MDAMKLLVATEIQSAVEAAVRKAMLSFGGIKSVDVSKLGPLQTQISIKQEGRGIRFFHVQVKESI